MSAGFLKYFLSEEARREGVEFKPPRELDAGFDLPCLGETVIEPGQCVSIRTGLHLAIPPKWVGIVKDRSSVALRGGITGAGVIDSGYRGEVKVIMYNLGKEPLHFSRGDRIAQCVLLEHHCGSECLGVDSLEALGETERGEGGFGSTGN